MGPTGPRWQRLALACLATVMAATASAAPVAAAYQASAYDNKTAFTTCIGSTSTIPQQLRALAVSAFSYLAYAPSSFEGTAFTAGTVLARAGADAGFYVHSHGDHYSTGWGFRVDGGSCSQGIVTSGQIKALRMTPEQWVRSANLVVASTCHLGESASDFPLGFGIAKVRSAPNGTNYQGRRFFLGYSGTAWTWDMLQFESRFWQYAKTGHNLGEAFAWTINDRVMVYGSSPTWWGSYTYSGVPGAVTPCSTCR